MQLSDSWSQCFQTYSQGDTICVTQSNPAISMPKTFVLFVHLTLYLVSPFMYVLLNANGNRMCSVTNTTCKPDIICDYILKEILGIVDL